jgi:hypothetical protein
MSVRSRWPSAEQLLALEDGAQRCGDLGQIRVDHR